jgi:hypothetical protein
VRRALQVLFACATLAAALTVVSSAVGARECDGLQVCVSVDGPWVVVPAAGGPARPDVEWHLTCPRGHVIGGIDAELSRREIDISFLGMMGSPINPGITTSRSATFVGTYVGRVARSSTFKPYIGCMPSAGGGTRIPTSASSPTVFQPGRPVVRRVNTVRVRPGSATVSQGCRAGERLVGARHAFGFDTRTPPSASLAASVSGSRSVRAGRVVVRVRGDAELGGVRALVQVQALCARTR